MNAANCAIVPFSFVFLMKDARSEDTDATGNHGIFRTVYQVYYLLQVYYRFIYCVLSLVSDILLIPTSVSCDEHRFQILIGLSL